MHCFFGTRQQLLTWLGLQYTFSLGRLSALMLCLFLVATGAGTVRPRLLVRNWVAIFALFVGFLTTSALGLPLTSLNLGTDSRAAFVASVVACVLSPPSLLQPVRALPALQRALRFTASAPPQSSECGGSAVECG